MNRFQRELMQEKKERMDQETQILLFSRKVSKALGISYEDVVTAAEIGMEWTIGEYIEYIIKAAIREFPTGKHAFLHVCPPVRLGPACQNFRVFDGGVQLPDYPTREDILRRIQIELSEDAKQEGEQETVAAVVMGENELNALFDRVKKEDI
jgi:hypothetical protein